jgi:rare lipoprotein A (peptidoglycan hydrolase)
MRMSPVKRTATWDDTSLVRILVLVAALATSWTSAAAAPPPPVAPLPATLDLHLSSHPSAVDLAQAQQQVDQLARRAQKQVDAVQRAARQSLVQRVSLRDAQARRSTAAVALSAAVRDTYINGGGGDRLLSFLAGISPDQDQSRRIGEVRALGLDTQVLRDARDSDAAATSAQAALTAQQRKLVDRSKPAAMLLAQADAALDQARVAFADDQSALQALEAQQAALFSTSQQLSYAVTPAAGTIGAAAAAEQQPVLDLLETTQFGALPKGFAPAGAGLTGIASWYGPGFVGNNTSSGSPYDPEQLTCAMLAVPLGTVVRVTNTTNGQQVSLLVTDHGPYVDGRIIDLSQRAALLLGLSLGPVTVEPLQRS